MYSVIGTGLRRSFHVSFGLRVGYGENAKEFTMEDAKTALHRWMRGRIERSLPYLTGQLVPAMTVYAWSDSGTPVTGEEAGAIFMGEVSVLYDKDATDEDVKKRLDELASSLGSSLQQTRIYVAYGEESWVVERENESTPTGN